MNAAQLINQTSLEVEYYTDPKVVAPAIGMVGQFDLDVASSAAANRIIGAGHFYHAPHFEIVAWWDNIPVRRHVNVGGTDLPWWGSVWMNHPFMAPVNPCQPGCERESCAKRGWHTLTRLPGNADWVNKLVSEVKSGNVTEAFCLTFACTSERWFQPLLEQYQCFLFPRTNYYLPDGTLKKGVTKGSVITYFGTRPRQFAKEYAHLGVVK